MGKEFWLDRWKQGAIGWHQNEVEPALISWATARKPTRVLVPLCGKSLDLVWLRDHGYEVVGVELSAIACELFFSEHEIAYSKIIRGDYVIYQGDGILIINGDFFSLTREWVGEFGAVYDRAALVALPSKMRVLYSKKIIEFKVKELLMIVLDRSTKDQEGPPYSVSPDEVLSLYGSIYEVNTLSKQAVEARGPEGSVTEEFVLLLNLKC